MEPGGSLDVRVAARRTSGGMKLGVSMAAPPHGCSAKSGPETEILLRFNNTALTHAVCFVTVERSLLKVAGNRGAFFACPKRND
jgi:hypothetical protein